MVQHSASKLSRADLADLNSFLSVYRLCNFTLATGKKILAFGRYRITIGVFGLKSCC